MDWAVADAVVQEHEYPCNVVVKAQAKGHWLLSDAIHRLAQLFLHLKSVQLFQGENGDLDFMEEDHDPPSP